MDASVYTRPNKPRYIDVKNRKDLDPLPKVEVPEILTVDKDTECHVTPDNVARVMVDYLNIDRWVFVLEPSAGTGQLVKALLKDGHRARDIVAIEKHHALAKACEDNCPGVEVYQSCFLEWANETSLTFPAIIMNPPFRKVKQHINAALDLLNDEDATLIALVPSTFDHPEMVHIKDLPNDTFALAKVNTKIVGFYR